MTNNYNLLDERVKKWIFQQGWTNLREIQNIAIEPILSAKTDILISASTAAGKTEAAFLPACSRVADQKEGIAILYISPLKALINDQHRRLESLTDLLSMQLTSWHGDSSQSKKNKLRKSPSGIVLITPESLESLLINDSGWFKRAFNFLQYIIIDEFHAFLGSERGHQLLSLLTRIEHLIGRLTEPVPRIALSATLGNLTSIPLSLRPNKRFPCQIIKESHAISSVKIQLKGYLEHAELNDEQNSETAKITNQSAEYQICQDLFRFCRGDNHLVFANSRKRVESIAAQLTDFCVQKILPNEFFPHHGSLSKELRGTLEARLLKGTLPTTAICTMTLELGIDIGKVYSVIQVTPPHSVSSLRQRLGRSGRRGNPAVLRMLIAENEIVQQSSLIDKLRLQLIQSLAMIRLLISSKWFEPADLDLYHFSTLLHQILAVITQWGGVRVEQLYQLLCKEGPFQNITPNIFKSLLTQMGAVNLVTQLHNGELILGIQGEQIVNHYSFFAVFNTPEEYRIVVGNKSLGTLPIDSPVLEGQHIIFGGQRWQVIEINSEKKIIYVNYAIGGIPPTFGGEGLSIHDVIRQEMYKLLCEQEYRITIEDKKVDFIDATAKMLFFEGCNTFRSLNLAKEVVIQEGEYVYILPWKGDKVINTIVALLLQQGFLVGAYAGVIEVENSTLAEIKTVLKQLAQSHLPDTQQLADFVPEKHLEKFDQYLPQDLLSLGYGTKAFDIVETQKWLLSLDFV